jgi:hypothetical protein
MATRADLETELSTYFGGANRFVVNPNPTPRYAGVVAAFDGAVEFFEGNGIRVNGARFEHPERFVLARHVPSGQWFLSGNIPS